MERALHPSIPVLEKAKICAFTNFILEFSRTKADQGTALLENVDSTDGVA